jgi:hypothetical protein
VLDPGALSVLGNLQWHWGSAYLIARPGPDIWVAQRADTRETLCATDPEQLREAIRADYAGRPVPRPAFPQQRARSAPGGALTPL